jgi:hypothetical protein
MQSEEPRIETEPPTEEDSDEVEAGTESEIARSPIDEDVAGSVNAAVPDAAEE